MLPQRGAEGAAQAQSYHDAWRKLPVFSTIPTEHLMKRDDGTASISIECQVYPWQQACHRCKGKEEWLPGGPHSRRFSGYARELVDWAAQRLISAHVSRRMYSPSVYKRRGNATVQKE